ncbi:RAMP superfamily CRISPR-associated protein [Vibrio spartinae]|uniref:CRISPR type III-B/RAMP module RAMP protein Cmr1 n=1 Tax=Vibrio spartinae TaxID=1918945 RepID=A0ABX6R4A7_9VIBR|nr:RAMP superfamily CRISPR-associated protein [Vibrio spartinae]QMV15987.1 CRISPR type III-B/RAMP module RAMP protein Cmr1 [Vibrio spartinae]
MTDTAFYEILKNKVDNVTKERCVAVTLTFESMAFLNNAEQMSPEWKQLAKCLTALKKDKKNQTLSYQRKKELEQERDELRDKITAHNQAEFPLASLKGGLRYWWRALQWVPTKLKAIQKNKKTKQLPEDEASIDKIALENLHQSERALWGSAEKSKGIGCSKVRIVPQNNQIQICRSSDIFPKTETQDKISPIQYIAGQAYKLNEGELSDMSLLRPVATSKGTISFLLYFSPELSEAHIRQVFEALLCFAEFGGLGSRSRKGFGSFSVSFTQSLIKEDGEALSQQKLHEQFINTIKQELIHSSEITNWRIPPIPAFSAATKWTQFSVDDKMTDQQLLVELGNAYKTARLQIGLNDKTRISNSPPQYPVRLQVGFPLVTNRFVIDKNHEPKNRERKTNYSMFYLGKEVKRRGSLVFLSCKLTDTGKYFIHALLLSSNFLPEYSSAKKLPYLKLSDANSPRKETHYKNIEFNPEDVTDELFGTGGFFAALTKNLNHSQYISQQSVVAGQGRNRDASKEK